MLKKVRFAVLRGICQTPAYVAKEKGFFESVGLDVSLHVEATAWIIPQRLTNHERDFAIMPWTRVAAAQSNDLPLVVVAGSGIEEAAIVVRKGLDLTQVRKVAMPKEGGIKDLTGMALIDSLGWQDVEILRMPSGDGAIISLFGQGSDAASMVEPYATLMEQMNVGSIIRRTGDIWKGAPGCSLATTCHLKEENRDLVQAVVNAHVQGANFVKSNPEESAEIAAYYIGISAKVIYNALRYNQPDPLAVYNTTAMKTILNLMQKLGYIKTIPSNYLDLTFLQQQPARILSS